jgi:hypothetical protein
MLLHVMCSLRASPAPIRRVSEAAQTPDAFVSRVFLTLHLGFVSGLKRCGEIRDGPPKAEDSILPPRPGHWRS